MNRKTNDGNIVLTLAWAAVFWIFIIGIIFFCLAASAHAATITARSLSQADVQAAVDSAANGDTVKLPAGSATWSTSVKLSKPIIVLGAGQGKTNITTAGGDCFYLKCATDQRLEIGAMSLSSSTNQQGFGITLDNSGVLLNSLVFHDINFSKFFSGFQNGTVGNSAGFGVCSHCTFLDCKIPTRNKGFLKSMSSAAVGNVPSPAWGTAKYMIIEDCTYTLDQSAWEFYLADTDGPMNVLFRHNEINITHTSPWTESGWDMHGDNAQGGVNAFRNGYGTIAHDNTFNVSGGAQVDKLSDIRGGVGSLIFDNVVTGSSSPNSVRNVIRANAFTDDRSTTTPTKTYFNNNKSNGNPVQLQNDGTGGQPGVNYWNDSGLPAGYTEVAYPSPLLAGAPVPTPTPAPPSVQDGTVIPVGIGNNALTAKAGTYKLIGTVTAPSGDQDSLWIDFDSDPSGDDAKCWDIDPQATAGEQTVKWRSADPKTWTLTAGAHTLQIGQREPATISKIKFVAAGNPGPTPSPTVTPAPTPAPTSSPTPAAPTYKAWEQQLNQNTNQWIDSHPPTPD